MFHLACFWRVGGILSVLMAVLLLGSGLASASLVLQLNPGDYQTSTNAWPIAAGSMAGDYFQSAGPLQGGQTYPSVTSKIYTNNTLGYNAVDFTAGPSILGGPLCPSSLGGANPKTIEAWVFQPSTVNGDAGTILALYSEYQAANSEFALCDSVNPGSTPNGNGRALYTTGGTIQGWGSAFPARSGNWSYLVASYDGANLNLYINGQLDRTVAYTYATGTNASIAIGCMRYGPATSAHSLANEDSWNNWRGYLGGIRVYDEARTATQITNDFNLGVNYGEVGTGLPYIVATGGTGGTISPSGTNFIAVGGSQAYTITTSYGYALNTVLVDGVNNSGAVSSGSYTFSSVTSNHTIAASWTALPTISGTVTNSSGPIYSVLVTASTNTDGSSPFVSRRTDSSGNYTLAVPSNTGTYYLLASKGSYVPSAVVTVTLSGSSVTGQNFNLVPTGTLDPVVNLDASALSSGALTSWANTGSAGGTLTNPAGWSGPTVQTVAGKNAVSFDGSTTLLKASFGTPAGITGQSDWSAAYWVYVTNFYSGDEYPFGWARNLSGLQECNVHYGSYNRAVDFNGNSLSFSGSTPAAGAWHLIVATYDGSTGKMYVDGALNNTQTGISLNLYPGDNMYVGSGVESDGSPITWAKFQGSVSSIQIFDQVLTAAQIDLMVNLAHNITPSAGLNGTITPATVQTVTNYNNSTFTFTPNAGYNISQVLVDGINNPAAVSAGAYTFSNVIAAHTIAVSFVSATLDTNVLVFLDASTLSAGSLASWSNQGYLGGTFSPYSSTNDPTVATVSGRQAVHFVQPDSTAASRQTLTNSVNAPASLSGNNPWSISADLYSTNLNFVSSENCYFCWAGSHQGVGTCAEFDYYSNQAYFHQDDGTGNPLGINGSFAHVPSANAWHNVTITYDGTTQTIYIDGAYDSSAAMSLALATNNMLMVGGRYYGGNGDRTQDQYWRLANAYIGKLQVFSEALTSLQVSNMFTPLSYAISGTVTVGGIPTAGVTVTLTGAGAYTTTTDGSGNYSVAVLVGSTNSPSPYTVTASGVGYSTSSQNVNVNGAALTGVNFALTLQDNLVGTVKTSGGAPIYNAIVQVGGSNGVFAISALDGTYRVGGIPTNSSVELYAKGLGYAAFINNIDTTGAATGVVTNNIVLTAQVATGVISNGGFEVIDPGSGIPSAWHEWAGYNCPDAGGNYVGGLGDDYISATSASGEVYSGTYAAEYNPNLYTPGGPSGAYTFLWQDVPVMSNSTYNVYWKMKADANVTAHVFCLISFRNSNTITNETDMFSYAGGVTTNWTQYPSASPAGQDAVFAPGQATRFAVPAGANVVNVLLGVDDSYTGPPLYFDDVVVDRNDLVSVPVTYTITATNGVGGVVSPSGAVVVTNGNNQTFTITPSGPAYSRNQVLVDGVNNRGAVTSGSYTFTSVNANHTIGASFTYNPPTAPGFLPVSIQSGNLVLRTATQVGYNYYLLQTTSLNPPVVWTTNSITAGTGGTITNTPAITSGQPKTFYRYMAQ